VAGYKVKGYCQDRCLCLRRGCAEGVDACWDVAEGFGDAPNFSVSHLKPSWIYVSREKKTPPSYLNVISWLVGLFIGVMQVSRSGLARLGEKGK
jgi:hypothetical protein